MDYLQYSNKNLKEVHIMNKSFKPYYKWITFNTGDIWTFMKIYEEDCFKPYYKWITFNTTIGVVLFTFLF